ncbi:MAG TPA: hypothetical protein VM492_18405, partial [Sumerlaeia bacterium]|nr:hypothetical protein [Sumerlaeia bacterium]
MRRGVSSAATASLCLLLASIFLARITVVNDQDVFLHIRTGQWIVENRAVPRADPFSFSAAGARWDNHQWLFQIFAFSLFRLGGLAALGLTRAAIWTLSFFLLYRVCRLRGAGAGLAAALVLVASVGTWHYNEPRPYIVTPLGLALLALAVEHVRRGERRWIALPPLVMLPWVNAHAGFTAGCLILLIAFAGASADWAARRFRVGAFGSRVPREHSRGRLCHTSPAVSPAVLHDLFLCGALTLGAVLCNPIGWRILLFPFRVVGHNLFMDLIQEWNPSVLGLDSAPFYAFAFLLGLRALTLGKRARIGDLASLVVFTWMALSSRRHTVLFFFVLTPVAAEWIQSLRKPSPVRKMDPVRVAQYVAPSAAPAPLASASHVAPSGDPAGGPGGWRRIVGWSMLLLAAAVWTLPIVLSARLLKFGLGYNTDIFPRRAADLILEYNLKPRLFNGYNFGGYLIHRLYPRYKVF